MSPLTHDQRRGLAWAFAAAVGGALMVIPWKLANDAGDPAISVLVLLAIAAIGNTALSVVQRGRDVGSLLRPSPVEWGVAALLAVFTLAGNWASAIAIQDLSPALLNVLLRADVAFVAVLGWWFLGERVERIFWLGAAIAVVGLVVMQGPIASNEIVAVLSSATGWALGGALCFGGLSVTTRYFIHRIDPVSVNSLRLWISVGFWFLLNGLPEWRAVPREQVIYGALAALTGPFLGRLALMISARFLEARVTTLVTLSTPVMTLGIAFVLLSDWPADHELLGGAVMIAGISIPLLGRARRRVRA